MSQDSLTHSATPPIPAIETAYAGCRFRSRLEARWAVAFDAFGWSWSYEPEGVQLPSGDRYLPDFSLDHRYIEYVEVKGVMTSRDETRLLDFCYHSQARVLVVGDIPRPDVGGCHGWYLMPGLYDFRVDSIGSVSPLVTRSTVMLAGSQGVPYPIGFAQVVGLGSESRGITRLNFSLTSDETTAFKWDLSLLASLCKAPPQRVAESFRAARSARFGT